MFTNEMHKRATTVSLSILVVVEMANAMNSLSQGESLLSLPIWSNMYLVGAITLSMALHFMILYVPFFSVSCHSSLDSLRNSLTLRSSVQTLFLITPLNVAEWKAVVALSMPVILVDEAFKLFEL